MFDLEQSIRDWRKQMLAAGIQIPEPLEELEIHLREETERQVKSGVSAQRAFESAIQKIGQPATLKNEFQKTNAPTIERKSITAIAGGILAALVGFLLLGAATVQCRNAGKMTSITSEWLVLGIILFFDGFAISFLASKRKA